MFQRPTIEDQMHFHEDPEQKKIPTQRIKMERTISYTTTTVLLLKPTGPTLGLTLQEMGGPHVLSLQFVPQKIPFNKFTTSSRHSPFPFSLQKKKNNILFGEPRTSMYKMTRCGKSTLIT